jgi:polyphosphate kinase
MKPKMSATRCSSGSVPLAIVDSNLDEFFMVRVGGLRMQRDAGMVGLTDDGMTPARLLAACAAKR